MRRWIAVAIAPAAALALPTAANAALVFSQTESADPVNKGDHETYTVSVQNTGSSVASAPQAFVGGFSRNGFKAVNNPYVSVTPSQGSCTIDNAEPAGFKSGYCTLGALGPGATATITAVVEMNESMDHSAGALPSGTSDVSYEPTTVIAPPELKGSKKIHLKGLPEGCAPDDFKLKAKAKGAKKIIASLKPLQYPEEKLKAANGAKLSVNVPAADLDQSRISELRVKATFVGKPQQKRTATFQRC